MSFTLWLLWAFVLIAQNFAFTFVSRARNSGSLRKHLIAGFFSNGVWFVSQIFAVGAFMSILTGKLGILPAIGAGLFYTLFTLAGSLLAHQYALKSEKGTSRVGAHKDIASFTKSEGDMLRTRTLLLDNGDGVGTFTLEEIGALKSLIVRESDEEREDLEAAFAQLESTPNQGDLQGYGPRAEYTVEGYGFSSKVTG
jgi:hypothetical protein